MMINIMSHSKKVLGLTPGHDPSVWSFSRWDRRGVQLTDDVPALQQTADLFQVYTVAQTALSSWTGEA